MTGRGLINGCTVMTGSVSCPVSNLGYGPHHVGGLVRDRAGNGTPINGDFIVGDRQPPTISNVLPTGIIYAGSTTITASYSDSSGINQGSVSISLDGSPLPGCTVAATGASCPESGLTLGPTIGGSVGDNAGNTAAIMRVTVSDNTAPVIDSPSADTLSLRIRPESWSRTMTSILQRYRPGFVRVPGQCPLAKLRRRHARCQLGDVNGLQFGRHLIGGSVSDNAGNTPIAGEFKIGDSVAPVVTKVQPAGTVAGNSTVISANFSDAEPSSGIDVASVSVTLDENLLEKCTVTEAGVSCLVTGLGAGTHKIGGSISDNAGNATTFSGAFETCLGGKPALSLGHRAFWASFADYSARNLSVEYKLASPGGPAYSVQITGNTNTNGVTLLTPLPYLVGDMASKGTAAAVFQYQLPVGVQSWRSRIFASAQDVCGTLYKFP